MAEGVRVERLPESMMAGVGEIILDRPEKRNALTVEMLRGIVDGVRELGADEGVRAIVLRGEGRVFCSGFDMLLCRDDAAVLGELLTGLSLAVRALRGARVPVVVAAGGAAVAGGCALLGGGDLVITDRLAKLGYPVVRLGISPAVSGPSLERLVGERQSRARMLDPELISGEEARRIGLAQMMVDLMEDVVPRSQIEAAKLARKPREAVMRTKLWMNELDGSDDIAAMERALAVSMGLVGSAEASERLAAMWGKND